MFEEEKKWVKENVFINGKVDSTSHLRKWWQKRNKEYIFDIIQNFNLYTFHSGNLRIKTKIYCFLNDIKEKPKCELCDIEVVFRDGTFPRRCHFHKNTGTDKTSKNEKTKNTILEKYGTTVLWKLDKETNERRMKTRKNLIENFENELIKSFEDFESNKIDNKIIIDLLFKKNGNLNGNLTTPYYFYKKTKDMILTKNLFYEYYKSYFPDKNKNQYFYDILNSKKMCKSCNNETMFIDFKKGYLNFCSTKCSNAFEEKRLQISNSIMNNPLTEKRKNFLFEQLKSIEEKHTKVIEEKFIILERGETNSSLTKFKLQCKTCKRFIETNFYQLRCFTCQPTKYNSEEKIVPYLNTSEEIFTKQRSIFEENKRKELDVYIPTLNFAVEFCGDYWHSSGLNDKFKNVPKKHQNKTLMCLNQNIKLFTIFEYEWNNEKIKNIWISKFDVVLKNISKKIYARKCIIKYITKTEENDFLNENHLQGNCNSKIKLGLFYDDQIVSVMTFGKARYDKNIEWELLRFSSLKNTIVIGGFDKLLKFFERTYNPKSLVSYANLRWSNGNIYENRGFQKVSITPPNYNYIHTSKNVLLSREKCQKHKLKKIIENFDSNLTEKQNMLNNGYRILYDCGNIKYIKTY